MGLAGTAQTDLVQYTDKWQAVVERVVNLQVPENLGSYFFLKKDSAPWNESVSLWVSELASKQASWLVGWLVG